ncbi:uncharacterized protein LOC110455263 [Mizuhopecten yessoensis]|uniref:Uncharacterized protein n=1 Tax=Mizuhopecten yessoensis TaxID=6573 RepID=A0A210QDA6_MIZYE|nr:uncharacterized protein LOC110455263 [Mizuhopecten yessoensis]OWF46719.1 hypothetical protein KP79_PYT21216 [Mizuhopecten yessoensis]
MVMNRGYYRTDHESVSDGKINEGNRRSQLPPLQEPRTSLRSYPPPEAGRRIMFPTKQETKKQFPQAEAKSAGMLPKIQGTNRGNSKFKGYVPGLTVRDAERKPIKEELSYLDKAMGKPTNLFPDVKDSQGIATRHMQKIKMKPRTLLTFEIMDNHLPQPESRYIDLPHIGAQTKMSPRSHESRLQTPTRCDSRAGGQKLPSLGGGRPGTSKARRGAPRHGY